MQRHLANAILTMILVCLVAVSCDVTGSGADEEPGTNDMFFKKKSKAVKNVIHETVGADLVRIDSFPGTANTVGAIDMSCEKVIAEGQPPSTTFRKADYGETYESGFLISNIPDRPPLVFQNTDALRFDVWDLVSDSDLRISRKHEGPSLHSEQDSWVGYFVLDAGCLLPDRILIAVRYDDPTAEFSLYTYDISGESFQHIADVGPEFHDPHRYFWIQQLDSDRAMVLFYSNPVREAAEIYHNYYNHFMLFERGKPSGTELLKLGIDTGNVEDWIVEDSLLFIRTIDQRGHSEPRRGQWSLDLSKVLAQ